MPKTDVVVIGGKYMKKLACLISIKGKTKEQLAREVHEAVQKYFKVERLVNHQNLAYIASMDKGKTKKCLCDNPDCAKCLLVNCIDTNCKTHPEKKKEEFRKKYKNR